MATAVRFARTHGLEVAVRRGGHGVLGFAVPAGGLMIDLSPLDAVTVDPDRRRATVRGGALDRATQQYGLATTAGNVSHTGVGGTVGAAADQPRLRVGRRPDEGRGAEPGEDTTGLPSAGLQAYGGTIADVAPEETAFGHRDTLVEFSAGIRWSDPAEDERRMAAARRYGAVMEPPRQRRVRQQRDR